VRWPYTGPRAVELRRSPVAALTGPWGCGASARSRRRLGSARSAPGRKNVLIFPRAAALGIGWRRGHRRLGGSVGGSVWRRRCGRAAARAGGGSVGGGGVTGGSVPVPGVVPPSAVLGAARRSAVRGPRFSGADSRAGFAARARTSGHCSSFYEGPAAAGDPVARPRRPRARRRPAPWAGCARRGPRRRGAVGVGPRGRVADSKADRRPEKLFGAAGGWRLGAGPRLGAARSRSWSRLRRFFLRRPGGCGRPGSSPPAPSSAPAGTLGGSARRGPRRLGAVGVRPRAGSALARRGLTE
jgi:hypothetical protein